MQLNELLKKHLIHLDIKTYSACQMGLFLMSLGVDPHHGKEHINALLDDLDYLLITKPDIYKHTRFEILLPAICWHDVWVASHQATSIPHLIYIQLVEGRGSARMWKKYSKKIINGKQASEIEYCIRKHSSFQILPTITHEAKILIDLDKLEVWNITRFIQQHNTLVSNKKIYSKYIVRMYFTYSWYVGLYFQELDKKLSMLRNKFYSELQQN